MERAMQRIMEVKQRYEVLLLEIPEVVGVGVGIKHFRPYIRVYVRKLIPEHEVLIPKFIEGFPVEVVVSGELRPLPLIQRVTRNRPLARRIVLNRPLLLRVLTESRKGKWRPVPGGVTIGHYLASAGTLSVRVYDKSTREKLVLSNNHVLALSNNNEKEYAKVGDVVLQPGFADGGVNGLDRLDDIAPLLRWVPIKVGDLERPMSEWPDNYVDCALGKPKNPDEVSTEILEIGCVKETAEALVGTGVKKSGRTTGFTTGRVVDVDFTGGVNYGWFIAKYVDQIVVEGTPPPFSKPGDSGSLIVDESNRAVGLLFAGNPEKNITICNKIQTVFTRLGIMFPTWTETPIPPKEVPKTKGKGTLGVDTQPVKGEVFVDGVSWGIAPQTRGVEEGDHVVSFGDVEGWITPYPRTVTIKENVSTTIMMTYKELVCVEHPRLRRLYEQAKRRGLTKTAERVGLICKRLER